MVPASRIVRAAGLRKFFEIFRAEWCIFSSIRKRKFVVCSVLDNLCNMNLVSVSGEDIKLKNMPRVSEKWGGTVPPPLLQKVWGTRTAVNHTFYAIV